MNELTFILAILVRKNVISLQEAGAIQKASRESVVSSSLGEMIIKVDQAMKVKKPELEKLDARDIIGK